MPAVTHPPSHLLLIPTLLLPRLLSRRHLSNAIRWCAAVQRELLRVDWQDELVTRMRDCGTLADEQGRVIWAGLRVRMGMSYGYASIKKPLNTGPCCSEGGSGGGWAGAGAGRGGAGQRGVYPRVSVSHERSCVVELSRC